MPYTLDQNGQKVLRALESSDYDWRTIDGISQETGIDPYKVAEILKFLPDVVRSSVPDKRGRLLFTTRSHYSRRQGIANRILSLLSDRVK